MEEIMVPDPVISIDRSNTNIKLYLPGKRHHRRRERDCECKEKDLLVLLKAVLSHPHHSGALIAQHLHLLKLLTGVDISTRPVNRTGRDGNAKNKINRKADAAPKTKSFRRSITMMRLFYISMLKMRAQMPNHVNGARRLHWKRNGRHWRILGSA